METCVSAPLDSITLGQAVTALTAIGTAVVVVAGLWWRSARAYSSLSELLKGKAEQGAVDAMREAQRERCAACRKNLDEALDRKASKAEVIAHGNEIASLARAQAVAEANAKATSDKLDDLKETMHGIAEKLERLLERQ